MSWENRQMLSLQRCSSLSRWCRRSLALSVKRTHEWRHSQTTATVNLIMAYELLKWAKTRPSSQEKRYGWGNGRKFHFIRREKFLLFPFCGHFFLFYFRMQGSFIFPIVTAAFDGLCAFYRFFCQKLLTHSLCCAVKCNFGFHTLEATQKTKWISWKQSRD